MACCCASSGRAEAGAVTSFASSRHQRGGGGGGRGGEPARATNMSFDFRRFDIYRKVPKDLTQPTFTGAIISVCCCFFILFLLLSELTGFIATEVVNELYVEDPDKDSSGKIEVTLNISLPNLHCELIGLDIQDEMGRHEIGHIDNSVKIPLNNGDGCRFESHFSINKIPGNFHVSTHSATAQPQNPDMTHVIHKLSFGDQLQAQKIRGSFNALEGADKLSSNPLASHDYILKIVPTVYEDMSGKQQYPFQYTVANKVRIATFFLEKLKNVNWRDLQLQVSFPLLLCCRACWAQNESNSSPCWKSGKMKRKRKFNSYLLGLPAREFLLFSFSFLQILSCCIVHIGSVH
uniref:Endoplasmic reticulum-Golgi intermediate compartment protein n=1 Tax=Anolis carolinensis TaxID=28377 RepID=A0A803STZ1_ANOCA